MSTQIAIRLPDDLVAQLDDQVDAGAAENRTALIRSLLQREMRRANARADLERLATDERDDLDSLAEWAVGHVPGSL